MDPGKQQTEWGLVLYTDGCSRGNPGEGGAGAILKDSRGETVARLTEYLGVVTNNVAEYRALMLGLREAVVRGYREVRIFVDSELIAHQINGVYRVRDVTLKALHEQVWEMLRQFRRWSILAIPREENREADRLARRAVKERAAQVIADPIP